MNIWSLKIQSQNRDFYFEFCPYVKTYIPSDVYKKKKSCRSYLVIHQEVKELKLLVSQLCLTLYHPTGCSLPGSSVHGISWQEYWSGLPCTSPGDLPDPGIEPTYPVSPTLEMGSLPLSHWGSLADAWIPSKIMASASALSYLAWGNYVEI